MNETAEVRIGFASYQGGKFELIAINIKTGEEIMLEGQLRPDQTLEQVDKVLPTCVYVNGVAQAPTDRERAAQIIYEAFPFDGGAAEKPPWLPGGNSLMQDRARRAADAIGASARLTPAQAPMDREKVAKIFAYIWHGDLGEWQGFLSKADAFLTYPVPSTPSEPAQAARQAIIEECAQAAENYDHRDSWSADPDMNAQGYFAAGETCDEIAKAIRALALSSTNLGSADCSWSPSRAS